MSARAWTILASLALSADAQAGDPQLINPVGTAALLKAGQWETGLIGPTRIGLREELEQRLHPLTALVSPNFALRFAHGEMAGGALSVKWGASVPTYALRMVQGDAAGTLFPTDVTIPWMVVPRAGMVWSRGGEEQLVTLRTDVTLGVAFEKKIMGDRSSRVGPTRSLVRPSPTATSAPRDHLRPGAPARFKVAQQPRSLRHGERRQPDDDPRPTGV